MLRLFVIFLSVTGIFACSMNNYNPTVYDYHFQEQQVAAANIKKVMVAPINFNTPSRHYLRAREKDVDAVVTTYLQESGYKTVPSKSFDSIWKKNLDEYGDMYDPTTGKMNGNFLPVLQSTIAKVFDQNPSLDAILFTDLVLEPMTINKSTKKSVAWSGVRRNIKVERLAYSEDKELDDEHQVDGISIVTHLLDRKSAILHHSKGGIQISQAIELNNSKGYFKRRKDLLEDEDEIREGIQLALHPFIPMQDYPGIKR